MQLGRVHPYLVDARDFIRINRRHPLFAGREKTLPQWIVRQRNTTAGVLQDVEGFFLGEATVLERIATRLSALGVWSVIAAGEIWSEKCLNDFSNFKTELRNLLTVLQVGILRNFNVLLDAQQNVGIIVAARALQQVPLLPIWRLIRPKYILAGLQTLRRPGRCTATVADFLALDAPVQSLFVAVPTTDGQFGLVRSDGTRVLTPGGHSEGAAQTTGPVDPPLDGTEGGVYAVPEGSQRGSAVSPDVEQLPAFGVGIGAQFDQGELGKNIWN